MQPELVLVADIRNGGQVVEGSQDGGTSCGTDEEWNLSPGFALQDHALQLGRNHFTVVVRRDNDAIVSAKATDRSTGLDRVMGLARGEHDQLTRQCSCPVLLELGEHLMASSEERVQVGDGSTGGQNGISSSPADNLSHLGQDNVLHEDEDRGNLVGEHVGVGRGGQPLPGHRDDVQSSRQLIEEVRVTCSRWTKERACPHVQLRELESDYYTRGGGVVLIF